VHNPWSKGTPNPAEFKLGSVYDYYDIYEELGRFASSFFIFNFSFKFTLNRFELCFSGAFGVVHRAVEKSTGKQFAAKFIPTPSAVEKNLVRKECEIMNQLIHPQLLNLHDVFDEGDEMVLITEL